MSEKAYNSTVAVRTRAAGQILETPDLLSKFLALGGLERDLISIRQAGLEAEAARLGQSVIKSEGKGATANVWVSFAALQREYQAVMAVISAVTAETKRNGESPDLIAKLEGILANETPVTVSTVEAKDAEGKSEKKRKVSKSEAQESIRAEIAKDAGALIAFSEVHPRLAERLVTLERLTALKQSAESLSGLLSERDSVKGEGKSSTQAVHDAVALQRNIWGGTYRILGALSRKDERVRSLLKEAKR